MIFGRRRRRAERERAAAEAEDLGFDGPPNRLDVLLAERIAAHFPQASVDGRTVDTGVAGLRIACLAKDADGAGRGQVAVPLFLNLSGGALGARPRFASISGYGETAETAVVEGACMWACTFGPVLGAGLTGSTHPDVTSFEVVRDGRRYRGVVDGLDRAVTFTDGLPEAGELTQQARALLGGDPWLAPRVARTADLPPFTGEHVLLSVFAMLLPDRVTWEVKVNGTDWEPACVRSGPADGIAGAGVMLRELVVLTPVPDGEDRDTAAGPFAATSQYAFPPLTRAEAQDALAAVARRTRPGAAAGWPGWHVHGGRLGEPMSAAALDDLETQVGPLPDDVRRFLGEVAGPGSAGPGFGLAHPHRVGDRLLVAHAGCKAAWVVRLDAGHLGQVWLDATEDQDTFVRVAPSMTAWYRRWLADAAADDRPWVHWDLSSCPTVDALAGGLVQVKEQAGGGPVRLNSLALASGPSDWLPGGALDPCQGCCDYVYRATSPDASFAPGPLAGTAAG